MAVLAFNAFVRPAPVGSHIICVALGAIFLALVLDRKILPFLDIPETVIVIGKAFAVYAEVLGNEEVPGDEDEPHKAYSYP